MFGKEREGKTDFSFLNLRNYEMFLKSTKRVIEILYDHLSHFYLVTAVRT